MKIYLLLFLLFFLFVQQAPGQRTPNYQPRLLRFEEDYSKLPDTLRKTDWWLGLKNIPLNQQGNVSASFGLDFREMYELIKGDEPGSVKDGYWLTRFMAHADVHYGKHWRTFFQLGTTFVTDRDLPIRPIDKDELFLLNGFVEFKTKENHYIRAGRQELFYGMGRLIAPREGPNIRNTYDALKLHFNSKNVVTDGFFSYVVNNKPGVFDNETFGDNQQLWGLYSTIKDKVVNTDLYYIGFRNQAGIYALQPNRGKELRHTVGARFAGSIVNGVRYDAELVYQFGAFGDFNISAYLADAIVSKSIKLNKSILKPSAKVSYASGDRRQNDKQLNTYNPLFPNLLYYQTAIGIFPANIINPQLNLGWEYGKMNVVAGADAFWQVSKEDGLYAPFGVIKLSNGKEKYLGYQLYTKADYQANRNVSFSLLLSKYYKSDVVRQNPDSRAIDLLVNLLFNYKL